MTYSQKHTVIYSAIAAFIIAVVANLFFLIYTEYSIYLGGIDLYYIDVNLLDDSNANNLPAITSHLFWKRAALHTIANFILLFILFYIGLNILYSKKIEQKYKLTSAVVINTVISCAFIYLDTLTMLHFNIHNNAEVYNTLGLVVAIGSRDFSLTAIVCLSLIIKYYVDRQEEMKSENEALKTANFMFKYEVLKTKLNPHFLFNSLNTLDSLIAINSNRSSEFVHKLSAIYRYVLNQTDITTVRDELNFAKFYGDLLIIRYEKCLTISYDVSDDILDCHLLPFSIQLLIENVVKHNTISNNHPMTINVVARDGKIEVTNSINPRREAISSSGLGLKMLNERIKLLNNHEIEISQINNTFRVIIPVI